MSEYYVPRFKFELVDFLCQYYLRESRRKFEKMGIRQLYAIYHNIRKKGLNNEQAKV